MGDLLGARYDADLVQGADLGRQAAVDTEHLAVDDGGEGEEVEDLAARLPHRGVAILLLALLVEAVDLCDLAGFVVAADQGDLVGESGGGVVSAVQISCVDFPKIKRLTSPSNT